MRDEENRPCGGVALPETVPLQGRAPDHAVARQAPAPVLPVQFVEEAVDVPAHRASFASFCFRVSARLAQPCGTTAHRTAVPAARTWVPSPASCTRGRL